MSRTGVATALEAVALFRKGEFVAPFLRRAQLSAGDRALAQSLTYGAVRRWTLWQRALRAFLKPRPSAFSQEVRDGLILMAVGLVELPTFAPQVLASALVSAVKKKDFRGSRALNAVARRMTEELRLWLEGLGEEAAPDLVGLTPWAYDQLKARGAEAFEALKVHMNRPPLLAVYATQEGEKLLAASGLRYRPSSRSGVFLLDEGLLPTALPGFEEGHLWPASVTSIEICARIADHLPQGAHLVELCAGRGVKTGLLRHMRPDVTLEAWDLSPNRLAVAQQRLQKAGLSDGVTFVAGDSRQMTPLRRPQAVFLDAPCSGSGTWSRHPESKWQATAQAVESLAQLSYELAAHGAQMLAPGGLFAFATCSLFQKENEENTDRFKALGLRPLEGEGRLWWPDCPQSDGFYSWLARKEEVDGTIF